MEKEEALKFFNFLKKKVGKELPPIVLLSISPEELPTPWKVDVIDLWGEKHTHLTEVMPDHVICKKFSYGNIPLAKLPNTIETEEFTVSNCDLESLPRNLTATHYISLDDNPIRNLPDDLTTGWISIENTNISEIPKNLQISTLFAKNTPLTSRFSEEEIKRIVKEKGGRVLGVHV